MTTYVPQSWTDGVGGATPISAARLEHMEAGIAAAADEAAVVAALAGVFASQSVTPTVEDLTFSRDLPDYTATRSGSVLVAHFPLVVISFGLLLWGQPNPGGLPASDTNYWQFDLSKRTLTAETVIATKNTKVTGGEAIPFRYDWNFDTVTWNTTNATLAKGDILWLPGYKTGTPASLTEVSCTVRYRPL